MPPYDPNVYVPPGVSPAVAYQIRTSGSRGVGAPPPAFNINDWMQAWINQDPVRLAQLQGIGGNVDQTVAGLQELADKGLINYGEIPTGYNVSDVVRRGAADATLGGISTTAQLAHNYGSYNAAAAGSLGARGAIRSGAYGAQALENQRAYRINQAQALLNLQNQLEGYHQQGLQARQTALGQMQTSDQDSLDRMIELIKAGVIAAPSSKPYVNPNLSYVPGVTPADQVQIPGGPVAQLPAVVNPNPQASGQVYPGGQPRVNPPAYGQPNPTVITPGYGPSGVPHPSPASYGQPKVAAPKPYAYNGPPPFHRALL